MDHPFWHRNADGTHQLTVRGQTHAQMIALAAKEGMTEAGLTTLMEIGSLVCVGDKLSPMEIVATKTVSAILDKHGIERPAEPAE